MTVIGEADRLTAITRGAVSKRSSSDQLPNPRPLTEAASTAQRLRRHSAAGAASALIDHRLDQLRKIVGGRIAIGR